MAADGVDGVAVDGMVAAGGARPSSAGWLRAHFSRLHTRMAMVPTAAMAMVLVGMDIPAILPTPGMGTSAIPPTPAIVSTRDMATPAIVPIPVIVKADMATPAIVPIPVIVTAEWLRRLSCLSGYAYTAAPYTYPYGY